MTVLEGVLQVLVGQAVVEVLPKIDPKRASCHLVQMVNPVFELLVGIVGESLQRAQIV